MFVSGVQFRTQVHVKTFFFYLGNGKNVPQNCDKEADIDQVIIWIFNILLNKFKIKA